MRLLGVLELVTNCGKCDGHEMAIAQDALDRMFLVHVALLDVGVYQLNVGLGRC